MVLVSKTIVFILSAVADQRKLRQNVGLENRNTTSNYDVTNNAHQNATEWKPHEIFLRNATGDKHPVRFAV